ncbi:deferrochelatase/peroxidase EfeB [Rahnella sp. BCC 1045]|jgi:deferrochelatase/peroxidase EfeB|uniref:iron uptake transporter deferrochelatase/peroxidase subunit n=1 Tax=unclassified Rahnella TaxID=2635087 RepID=UPI001AD88A67|nr:MULTISPECIES: iron uptake transporter deferrochelatase/peroxidase subunit [unclassified Rahnella]MBU9820315.1 deferrochelatase/peroxidase EfeB [Rahnella sp. BCC 1045]MCS3422824.1 deferrochelatase/peroxidase EfeB [Rahnella sp. BIGb0603]
MSDKLHPAREAGKFSRRELLKGAVAGASALAIPTVSYAHGQATAARDPEDKIDLSRQYSFYGHEGQVGISTPPQRHIMYMTFDLTTSARQDLQVLLARWSSAIAQLMKGGTIGQVEPARDSGVGMDTGEAMDLGPASLTVTVGLGPRVFTDTFGLTQHKPVLMRNLMQLPSDDMQPELTGGDLSLQACADDPQVAYHAIRDLARIAKSTGAAQTRWTVMGFGRASAGKGQSTPRNLFGFKDGTRNITEKADFDKYVWIKDGGPAWQQNGSYQVVRKIKIHIESWDTDRVSDQNNVFGRHKVSGAPLTGTKEFDTPDFKKKDADGNLIIPATAHISLASHENNQGIKILRRSYNYTDGLNNMAQLDAGLLFISYQKDPAQFEALQTRLGSSDALNEYISHIGSGIFFVPPAPKEGSYIGAEMFES